jgi:hypothetical protein
MRKTSRSIPPYPLDIVYAQAGIPAPETREVAPSRIPLPYRSLLVHERDMTLTLESHFGGRVTLRALSTFRKGQSYCCATVASTTAAGPPSFWPSRPTPR